MKVISAEEVHKSLSYPQLIDSLQDAYGGDYSMPPRQVFLLDEDKGHEAFAVLPSWNQELIGVKAFTYFPGLLSLINLFTQKFCFLIEGMVSH